MREIVLDTETTGLDPNGAHRIVEIGCLELANHVPTGRSFHTYINPERSMPTDAFEVHGLSEAFLAGQPLFGDVAVEFLDFIDDAPLVIHNARFDVGFLNSELKRVGRELLPESCSIDTVELARRKFPGAPANLDALCRRFGIDNAARTKHGALLDAELLAEVLSRTCWWSAARSGVCWCRGGWRNGRSDRAKPARATAPCAVR